MKIKRRDTDSELLREKIIEEAKDTIKKLKNNLENGDEEVDMVVVKSKPMSKALQARWDTMRQEAHEVMNRLKRSMAERDLLWADVQEELGAYDENLRYNEVTKEIEFLEERK